MRRASTIVAVLGAALAALPAAASALPTVHLKAQLVPIPKPGGGTWKNTGDFLGKGAALKTEFRIEGTEYFGHQPPLKQVVVQFPTGTKITSKGFTTCTPSIIEVQKEPKKCPKGSSAGTGGYAEGDVYFGGEEVKETVSIEPFFVPGGGIDFFSEGHKPAIIEITSKGRFLSLGSSGGYGPKFLAEVPEVVTVPEAPFASVERIVAVTGAAFMKHGKLVSYGTVPTKCPKGGFPLKAELTWYSVSTTGGATLPEQTASTTYKAPCPRK